MARPRLRLAQRTIGKMSHPVGIGGQIANFLSVTATFVGGETGVASDDSNTFMAELPCEGHAHC